MIIVPRVQQAVNLSLCFQDYQETISISFNDFVCRQEFTEKGTDD